MPLHQWDYIFAFGTIFATLDAYNIGANDVANVSPLFQFGPVYAYSAYLTTLMTDPFISPN
jgi:phosphate/sulfate permease